MYVIIGTVICFRKNIKKSKENYTVKKEIVKLRSYFENISLKNKSSTKEIERIINVQSRSKRKNSYPISNNDDNELIENEMALYLDKSVDDYVKLTVQNDCDFKLMIKEKPILQDENNIKRNLKSIKCNSDMLDFDENKKELSQNDIFKCPTNECLDVDQKTRIFINSMPQLNEVKNDLQSLLIMMAVNSNTDENIEHVNTLQETKRFEGDARENVYEEIDSTQSKFGLPNDLIPFLNIIPIRKDLTNRERYITNKYIKKWQSYVTAKKENLVLDQRQETLKNFFDKLSKKKNKVINNAEPTQKAKLVARDYDTYQHRSEETS